jgi:hypothetical protein
VVIIFFPCPKNIQSSIGGEFPDWPSLTAGIAQEWGWTISRMDKDAMLLREAIERIPDTEFPVAPLERITQKLQKFWTI